MLRDHVAALATDISARLNSASHATVMEMVAERLESPLRVAVVGRVKAGKSTLLNAMIGERLAPTNFSECTRVVTWYCDGVAHSVTADLVDGSTATLAAPRRGTHLDIDLGPHTVEQINRLIVVRPSAALRRMTLIDTPGLGSTSDWLGERTLEQFAGSGGPGPADAVIYLLRHLHEDDVSFLESFQAGTGDPTNSIAVLSRADEIGGLDDTFLKEAQAIAQRLANGPQLASLVHTVVPISGLLGETAATLTEEEYQQVAKFARLTAEDLAATCRTVDRFATRYPELEISQEQRQQLLKRFGLFGIRTAATAVQMRTAADSSRLQQRLLRASRLDELTQLVERVFESRADVLKARSALMMLRAFVERDGAQHVDLIERCDALLEAPAFHELDLLTQLRGLDAAAKLPQINDLGLIGSLLGEQGSAPWQRLGVAADAPPSERSAAAADCLNRLRRLRSDPRVRGTLRPLVDAAIVAGEALV
jgi:50S ribosome-binding GTPase